MRTSSTKGVRRASARSEGPRSGVETSSGSGVLEAENVRVNVFCPRRTHDAVAASAYELWHRVWLSTFRQLDGATHLDSNEFSRQDEVLALSHDGACLAVTALRWVDRSTRVAREDSYFRQWPDDALRQVGPALAVSSNTVVAESVRRTRIRTSGGELQRLSELTIAMALRRFIASTYPEFVGIARNDRRMDRVGATLGGRVIGRIVMHGEDSDIFLFSRSTLPPLGPAVEDIWTRSNVGGDGGP